MVFVLALALALVLAACQGDGRNCVRLPMGAWYCMVAGPWAEFSVEQATTVSYQGKPVHLITRIESDKKGLQFAGLSPLGQTLLRISWENDALAAELPPALQGRLNPVLFPALLQMALWPAEQVRGGLASGLVLIDADGRRIIRDGQQDIVIISWEGKTLPYRQLRFELPSAELVIEARTLEEVEAP